MPLQIVTVPCRTDNYAFLAHDPATGQTAVVDVPEAAPIAAALAERDWKLRDILLTHHHTDHVEGVETLRAMTGARVQGAAADAHRLPRLDRALTEGEAVLIGSDEGVVVDVSGHTVGHIAFHFPASQVVFTADSLMALGCGRVFEGTMQMMWESLSKLAALPPETLVCSGHEYTAANARFALSVDPDNPALRARADAVAQARAEGRATVPSRLSEELATNPFLRAADPAIRAHLGLQGATDADVFAELRRRKDAF
ncbi:MAG: hydroxyacylglutathione hydrolase [Rhodobacteraceae bacterium]|nr:hydroxyacylglutathione hydrolase [Paracoccaceae bacterium]